MSNSIIKRIAIYFLLLVMLQIPMLHNWVLFGTAFPFAYIGFIILLPYQIPRSWHMIIGFLLGLIIDVFSNTPGMHASVSVLIAYLRNIWLGITTDVTDEDLDISIQHLGVVGFLIFLLPLVFVHHLLMFVLENEGVTGFLRILSKSFWSTLLSSSIIVLAVIVAIRPKRRI